MSRQDRAATPDLLPLVQDWTVEAFQGEEAAKELPGPRICQQAPRDDEKFGQFLTKIKRVFDQNLSLTRGPFPGTVCAT